MRELDHDLFDLVLRDVVLPEFLVVDEDPARGLIGDEARQGESPSEAEDELERDREVLNSMHLVVLGQEVDG